MLAAVYNIKEKRYTRQMTIWEVDYENLTKAIDFFEIYKEQKVILNKNFKDDIWVFTNQLQKYTVNFEFSEIKFGQNTKHWIGCDSKCFKNCAKAYIIFNLGALSLETIRRVNKEFNELAESTISEAVKTWDYLNHISEFLKIIPGDSEERNFVIEELDENRLFSKQKQNGNKQRTLADFNSYLRFEEILNDFWELADDENKAFYFPLYFWWKLTSILPLRPMELLLTPRNCLEKNCNGENILTVRRTKLKGGNEKITYRVEGDYEYKKYVVPDSLAHEIQNYVLLTEKMKRPEIGTLISREPYCRTVRMSKKIVHRFYSYSDLSVTLEHFLAQYVNKETPVRIHLGDTRHIAMASLIISGGSPVICKELAGHTDINISSHYYTNISNLVECLVLDKYRKIKGKSARIQGKQKFTTVLPKERHRISNGWCDDMRVKNGDVSECLKVIDDDGHIGNCDFCCHYWPDLQGLRLEFFDDRNGKNKVDFDCQFLMQIIELARKGIGCEENIEQALLRLQRSCDHYSKCLWEKYTREDKGDGEAQKS